MNWEKADLLADKLSAAGFQAVSINYYIYFRNVLTDYGNVDWSDVSQVIGEEVCPIKISFDSFSEEAGIINVDDQVSVLVRR